MNYRIGAAIFGSLTLAMSVGVIGAVAIASITWSIINLALLVAL